MFDHVVFGVSDYAASKAFFLAALAPLGVAVGLEGPSGLEMSADQKGSLCRFPPDQRKALDGIIFINRTGCQWNALPRQFGSDSSVHRTYQRWVALGLFQTDEKPARLHLAFRATSRQQVDAFHRAALAAGAEDNGAPGPRPRYHANYYAAFVIGPDGHNIEVVCHEPVA